MNKTEMSEVTLTGTPDLKYCPKGQIVTFQQFILNKFFSVWGFSPDTARHFVRSIISRSKLSEPKKSVACNFIPQ